ncbi:MAG: site-specific integrase [Muribaculaceae bacterium]|nr:site-specific integrase [Muribaculaceae bacterium]
MATTKRELSQKINSAGKSEIIIRLTIGRGIQPRLKSGLYIAPARFKDGAIIKPRANQVEAADLRKLEAELCELEQFLLSLCADTPKEQINKDYLNEQIDRHRHPEKYQVKQAEPPTFYATFSTFLKSRNLSDMRTRHYWVLERAIKRFEEYKRATTAPGYTITLDGFTIADVTEFAAFLKNEPQIHEKHPDLCKLIPEFSPKIRKPQKPKQRGANTIIGMLARFRAFYNWCNEQEITNNRPFAKYDGITAEKYGTPYYITSEERDRIADFDLSASPELEAQRDIFIFQCLIGCRVSDLLRLTPANIINGAVEYIASKTKQERPEVIRVPLHPRAAALIEKYAGRTDGRLFPFTLLQPYNYAIKKIFTECGITRSVTILNPTTGKEEQRPLNEIASSHIARRTFVGNLYRKVKDPNLVGKLSGHKEGSKAFARYRDIDEDMKRDLINLL